MSSIRDDILSFLRDPKGFAGYGMDDAQKQLWLRGLTDFAEPLLHEPGSRQLRSAQRAAWVGLADQRVGLLLGPPGTGKTHLLAWMAAGYLWSRREAKLACRVLISGFTRESMGNLLDALAPILSAHLDDIPCAFLGNVPASDLDPRTQMISLAGRNLQQTAWKWLNDQPRLVAAATNWSIEKLMRIAGGDGHTTRMFDLVLIDEASQTLVSQGLMTLSGIAEGARIIVAGDDRQLAPLRPTFEAPTADGRALGASLYTFLKSGNVAEFPLEETFRLNDPLVHFPREHIYGPNYRSAVPARRLQLSTMWRQGLSDWQRIVLDPENPVVVVLHDGPPAGTENPFERHQIRSLVSLLSQRMMPRASETPLRPQTLWNIQLAVITPHRAQNAALRDELRPLGLGDAYVETVDRIQGRERDVIIAGYCVADPEFATQLAEFLFSAQRLNVMVTRPRSKLILFVSRRLLEVVPADDEVFGDAWLLREYLYECELAGTVELEGPDGAPHPAELRVRRFASAAEMREESAVIDATANPEPNRPAPEQIVHIRYSDPSLTNATLMKELALAERPYTYIVATSALEKERADLAAPHQDGLKFDKVLRLMINRPLLTRTEEQLALRRGIQQDITDPKVADQVRHDLFTWLEALAEMAERGLDLTGDVTDDLRQRFVSRHALEVVGRLQAALRTQKQKLSATRRSFEEMAREFLNGPEFRIPGDVIMEGFTFLTPMQTLFVESSLRVGSRVHFVYPYVPEQRRGFAVMDRTYAPYKHNSLVRQLPSSPIPGGENPLSHLRQALFADVDSVPATPTDDSVTVGVHPHRHAEVAASIEQIARYVQTGQYGPEEIAIVARNPVELHALMQEQVRLQKTVGQTKIALRLKIPPRMLLLTPIGRFALTLYEIRRDGAFQMAAEQFETMIASGWLGATVQDTTDIFNATRAQLFERCRTLQDWRDALQQLEEMGQVIKDDSRLPGRLAVKAVLSRWRSALDRVQELSERLFAGGERTIGNRVAQLLDELSALDPNIRQAELEIIERIREALTELTEVDGHAVTGEEFGDILNGMVKEYQQAKPAGDEVGGPGEVLITTPEGIDSCAKKVVFYLAVDDQRVPRPSSQPWPLWEVKLDENQDKERYMFLAVVRAATERLHLSYARMGEGSTYRPSPYLEESARVLGLPLPTDSPVPKESPAPTSCSTPVAIPSESYLLHEIAEFRLCPYRYKLERLDPDSGVCRELFQMGYQAQAAWHQAILDAIVGRVVTGTAAIRKLFLDTILATRAQVRAMFPALRNLNWQAVEDHVRGTLWGDAKFLGGENGNAMVRFERTPTRIRYEITRGTRVITVDCGIEHVVIRGDKLLPIFTPLMYREWMLPSLKSEGHHKSKRKGSVLKKTIQVDGMELFSGLSHAVQWWANEATRPAFACASSRKNPDAEDKYEHRKAEIAQVISQIEAGRFPKNPNLDGHCRFCPVKGLCLGIAEELV